MEFLERVSVDPQWEQWLVRDGNELRIAHVLFEEESEALERIETGTRTWLGLSHARAVAVHSIIHRGDQLVVVTGDERGRRFLRTARELPDLEERERWAVAELCGIADAISAMAERVPGFVHRRASDEQIVVGADGIARLRAPIERVSVGVRAGYLGRGRHVPMLRWMSPEQVLGHAPSPASDVFQLGFTLYCTLLGRYPFDNNDLAVMQGIAHGKPALPPIPSIVPGLREVVEHALRRDPRERFSSVAALVAELRRCVPDEVDAETRRKLVHEPSHPPPIQSAAIVGFRCQQRWDALAPTAVDGIRHCDACRQDVVQVRSIEAAIPLLGRSCIRYEE